MRGLDERGNARHLHLDKDEKKLVRDLHPDRMIARGIPIEAQRLAEQRLAAVNDAYSLIRQERRTRETA